MNLTVTVVVVVAITMFAVFGSRYYYITQKRQLKNQNSRTRTSATKSPATGTALERKDASKSKAEPPVSMSLSSEKQPQSKDVAEASTTSVNTDDEGSLVGTRSGRRITVFIATSILVISILVIIGTALYVTLNTMHVQDSSIPDMTQVPSGTPPQDVEATITQNIGSTFTRWMLDFSTQAGPLFYVIVGGLLAALVSLTVIGISSFMFSVPRVDAEESRGRSFLSWVSRHGASVGLLSGLFVAVAASLITLYALYPQLFVLWAVRIGLVLMSVVTVVSAPIGGPAVLGTIVCGLLLLQLLAYVVYITVKIRRSSVRKPVYAHMGDLSGDDLGSTSGKVVLGIKCVLVIASILGTLIASLFTDLWPYGFSAIGLSFILFFSTKVAKAGKGRRQTTKDAAQL